MTCLGHSRFSRCGRQKNPKLVRKQKPGENHHNSHPDFREKHQAVPGLLNPSLAEVELEGLYTVRKLLDNIHSRVLVGPFWTRFTPLHGRSIGLNC